MKHLLIALLMLLPTLGSAQTTIPEGLDTVEQSYNPEFIDDLGKAIETQDFSIMRPYFTDTVGFHKETTDKVTWPPAENVIEFFDYIFKSTMGYSYEIYVIQSGDILIYRLNYYLFVPDEQNEPVYSVIVFGFSERDGKIDVVLAP